MTSFCYALNTEEEGEEGGEGEEEKDDPFWLIFSVCVTSWEEIHSSPRRLLLKPKTGIILSFPLLLSYLMLLFTFLIVLFCRSLSNFFLIILLLSLFTNVQSFRRPPWWPASQEYWNGLEEEIILSCGNESSEKMVTIYSRETFTYPWKRKSKIKVTYNIFWGEVQHTLRRSTTYYENTLKRGKTSFRKLLCAIFLYLLDDLFDGLDSHLVCVRMQMLLQLPIRVQVHVSVFAL